MIKSPDEYLFIKYPDGMLVNGEIMPFREGEKKKIMRGEDVGFLLEAFHHLYAVQEGEIFGYLTYPEERYFLIDEFYETGFVIRSYRLRQIIVYLEDFFSLGWDIGYWITNAPMNPIYDVNDTALGGEIKKLYNLPPYESDLHCSQDRFEPRLPMYAKDIENIFDAINMLRYYDTGRVESKTNFTRTTEINVGPGSYEPSLPHDDSYTLYENEVFTFTNNLGQKSGWDYTIKYETGDIYFKLSDVYYVEDERYKGKYITLDMIKKVLSSECIMYLNIVLNVKNSRSILILYPVRAYSSDGDHYSIPDESVIEIIDSILDHYKDEITPKHWEDLPLYESYDLRIHLNGISYGRVVFKLSGKTLY